MKINPTLAVYIDAETIIRISANLLSISYLIGLVIVILFWSVLRSLDKKRKTSTALTILHKVVYYTSSQHITEVLGLRRLEVQLPTYGMWPISVGKRLVSQENQFKFYLLYLSLFPLQLSILVFIIMETLFSEEYFSESCKTYQDIKGLKAEDQRSYSCRLSESIVSAEPIDAYCNRTSNGTSFPDIPNEINCIRFYRETDKWVYIVANFYAWQQILVGVNIKLIFFYLWLYKYWQHYASRLNPIIHSFCYITLTSIMAFVLVTLSFFTYLIIANAATRSAILFSIGYSATWVAYFTSFTLSSLICYTCKDSTFATDMLNSQAYPFVLDLIPQRAENSIQDTHPEPSSDETSPLLISWNASQYYLTDDDSEIGRGEWVIDDINHDEFRLILKDFSSGSTLLHDVIYHLIRYRVETIE